MSRTYQGNPAITAQKIKKIAGNEWIINPDPIIVLDSKDELVLIGTAAFEKPFTQEYPAGA